MQATIMSLVDTLFIIYTYLILGYVIMSWVPNLRESTLGEIIGKIVEPVLEPFRRIIPPLGMIDISPIVAIFAVQIAKIGALAIIDMIFR